jgi:tetratricopeptide (TPR) repeat protein
MAYAAECVQRDAPVMHNRRMPVSVKSHRGLPLAALLIAGVAIAQADDPHQNDPSNKDAAATSQHELVVTAPRIDQPLPPLPPDEFNDCMKMGTQGSDSFDPTQSMICQQQFNREKRIVIEACVNENQKATPARVVQACTELLDRNIFEHYERYSVYANRAKAYFDQGDSAHALNDYNEAVKSSPHNAELYYRRGLLYEAQSDYDAALRDFDAALGVDRKLVSVFQQRARIYEIRQNFSGALFDYSEAIRLQPKSAALWCERGYASLRNKDYESAVKDEEEAVRLDPKLARAYFLRGAAFGNLGNSRDASSDIKTAVELDPLLVRYVVIEGKSASLRLPPPP